MTTATDPAQGTTLYGPDGRPLPRPATQPAPEAPRPSAQSGDWQPVTRQGNATIWEKPATAQPALPAQPELSEYQQAGVDAHQVRIAELEARIAIETTKDRPITARTKPEPDTLATAPAPAKPWFDRHGPTIAMYAAVGLSASGEYALATFAGFPHPVAALLPIAMDVYVIQAMRRHRDVAAALILAVAANALDRLAQAGLVGVDTTGHATWWLIVSVVAIAPFIVWRVHRITETRPAPASETEPEATATEHETPPSETTTTAATTAGPRETTVAHDTVAATATPRETVRATLPDRSTQPHETAPATGRPAPNATRETAAHQRETASATRNETRRTSAAATAAAMKSAVATPIARDEQLVIVGRFVDAWNGPEEKLPLQPIADALGRSKPTASRLVREYRTSKSA